MATELDSLKARCEAARELARREPTEVNREAAKAAWAALEAATPNQRKPWGYSTRAGKRQQAEFRALHPARRR